MCCERCLFRWLGSGFLVDLAFNDWFRLCGFFHGHGLRLRHLDRNRLGVGELVQTGRGLL
jgi:hypothetical protein